MSKPTWKPTHTVTCYKASPERVVVLVDRTHREYGFLYGDVQVRDETGNTRWIQFGLYNYKALESI